MSEAYFEAEAAPQGDPMAVIQSYRRHLWLFLAVAAVVAVLVALALMLMPKSYTSVASLLMVSDTGMQMAPTASGQGQTKPTSNTALNSYIDTQVEMLKSRDLSHRVATKLGLYADPEFNKHTGGAPVSADAREMVITAVQNHLKVRRAAETFVVNIGFVSHSPTRAADIANAFAAGFIDQQQQLKIKAFKAVTSLVNARLDGLRADVERDERAVASYRQAHGLLGVEGSSLAEQEISNLSQQLALTRASQAETDAKLSTARAQIRAGSSGEDVAAALDSKVVQELRRQRAEVSAKLADMEGRLGPKHPDMITTKRQLADVDQQIHLEIERDISNLKAQAQVAQERSASVASSLGLARGALAQNTGASVALAELQRNADTSRTLYEAYLGRSKENAQLELTTQPDAQIASIAQPPPVPSSPNKPLDVFVGAVLGLAAGAGAVAVRRLLDSGLRTQEDVERKLRMTYLAGVPTLASAIAKPETRSPVAAIMAHPMSSYAEAFRSIITGLTAARSTGAVKTVALMSSLPDEGKTTATICLAETLALGGSRVVVVDCDLRRRHVGAFMNLDCKVGLYDVLSGKVALRDAVIRDEASGVHVLPIPQGAAATVQSPLNTPEFDQLLANLRETFDYVLLDTPPLLPIVDSRMLAPKVDAVVLLVRWGRTPAKAVQHALKLLTSVNVAPAGVALTLVDLKVQQKYGYGDSAYYYKSYGKYYTAGSRA